MKNEIYIVTRFSPPGAYLRHENDTHQHALESLEKHLEGLGCNINYLDRRDRSFQLPDDAKVISLGGDGSALAAAALLNSENQSLLAINSSPKTSMGILCAAPYTQLDGLLGDWLNQRAHIVRIPRINFECNGLHVGHYALNEGLFAHANPAAMTRYRIAVVQNDVALHEEEHKSSGLWLSAPAGSTGAATSAGGAMLPLEEESIQVVVREPYQLEQQYSITQNVYSPENSIHIEVLDRESSLYLDGPYRETRLRRGDRLSLNLKAPKLSLVVSDEMLKRRKRLSKGLK